MFKLSRPGLLVLFILKIAVNNNECTFGVVFLLQFKFVANQGPP